MWCHKTSVVKAPCLQYVIEIPIRLNSRFEGISFIN
jgi:hypothetical protein